MNVRIINISSLVALMLLCYDVHAYYNNTSQGANNRQLGSVRADCSPATTREFLSFNNANALIETGGIMWIDRANSRPGYEIPKNSGKFAIFAGALWMGGEDVNGQLKIAALRFRSGNDFWTGPLKGHLAGSGDVDNGILPHGAAEIDPEECAYYDQFYIITRAEVEAFNAWWQCVNIDPNCDAAVRFPGYTIPRSITEWPAAGIFDGQDGFLAPYFDNDKNGEYNPIDGGDYPYYDLTGERDCRSERLVTLFGDYTMWWVFNDKGNIHTETNGESIGMEIHAQAFAFATNDEVNSMTFYNYELINRSTQSLNNTYFAQYVDTDVGGSQDDYIGCDVSRGLGYGYNGDADDDPSSTSGIAGINYGTSPPAIGFDFFEGPYQDNDGIDNPLTNDINVAIAQDGIVYPGIGIGYGDGIIDNERLGMRRFVYYNANQGSQGDPDNAVDYYNYMNGLWRDNSPFLFGGTGYANTATTTIESDYMFPDDSDPLNWATRGIAPPAGSERWSEQTEMNPPGDRRLMQCAGPFTLQPGALNNITVGVVYARTTNTDPFESVRLLQTADDKAQKLFDNCFEILSGPPAPDLTIQELDQELILTISGTPEDFQVVDPFIVIPPNASGDSIYRFEGYQIFQVASDEVGPGDLLDNDQARLVAQCDIQNGVARLINFETDGSLGTIVPTLMVDGADNGIQHSFSITDDQFAQGATRLVNHRKYHYIAIAYAHNNYKDFDPLDVSLIDGQKVPYLSSRNTLTGGAISPVTAIPHMTQPEKNGTLQRANFGDQPAITRIEGQGNGGNSLDISPESEAEILQNNFATELTYQAGGGPINVKVIDPLNVPLADFELRFHDTLNIDSTLWSLTNLTTGEVVTSDQAITIGNEQLIPEWGLSVDIEQYIYPELTGVTNPAEPITEVIESSMTENDWLTGVSDQEGNTWYNWIRSGATIVDDNTDPSFFWQDRARGNNPIDENSLFEGIVNGTVAPYYLMTSQLDNTMGIRVRHSPVVNEGNIINFTYGPSGRIIYQQLIDLPSIDLVFTSDKSKWTRSPVLETQDVPAAANGTNKGRMKDLASVDKNGDSTNPGGGENNSDFISARGMGWFPGYAIDVETGERLNIAFGEDTWLAGENGNDMLFNPTSNLQEAFFNEEGTHIRWGGKHYIYIFSNKKRIEEEYANYPQYQGNDNNDDNDAVPAYDNGQFLANTLNSNNSLTLARTWASCAWVMIPMATEGGEWLSSDVRVRVRVSKRYFPYEPQGATITNNGYPLYRFNTGSIATEVSNTPIAEDALDDIRAVPNPYYGSSTYEQSALDNLVKITNLPDRCEVNIYNTSGTLIRSFSKDNSITSLDWDLTNHTGIPIAGGVYYIHVKADGIGETVVKWFGVLRQTELDNF